LEAVDIRAHILAPIVSDQAMIAFCLSLYTTAETRETLISSENGDVLS